MRTFRALQSGRIAAAASLALTAACAASHPGQREARAPETAPEIPAIPVAMATVATPAAVEMERPRVERGPPAPEPVDPVERVLAVARAGVGRRGGASGIDCSTYVRTAFSAAGIDLYADGTSRDNGVQAIHRYVRRHGRLHRRGAPAKGELVFFDNSYDRNRNRLLDDRLTHVGIVEEVLADGTALVLHATNHGVVREPMNLRRPHASRSARGEPINATLRRRTVHDTPRTPHLMGELFAGFGLVIGVDRHPEPSARRAPQRARR
jgi:peptidoglycan DL-endopeptidase CwlO